MKVKQSYPWLIWLKAGSKHLLTKGIEYHCKTDVFVVHAYQTAKRKGIKLSIFRIGKNALLIQAHKGSQDGRTNWREVREEHG